MASFYDVDPYMAVKSGVKELSEKTAQMKGIRSTSALEKTSTALICCSEKLANLSISMEQDETVSFSSYRP